MKATPERGYFSYGCFSLAEAFHLYLKMRFCSAMEYFCTFAMDTCDFSETIFR